MEAETAVKNRFRHEFKYLCSEAQGRMLQSRLQGIMKNDRMANSDGMYKIRSLHFDDMYNRCYYENENGVSPREKYRIRIYNGNTDVIHLECKRKIRGMTQKEMCPLSYRQYRILAGLDPQTSPFSEFPELMQKLLYLMKTSLMRPKVIVEYDRRPFIYRDGNVRVTLDGNISSCGKVTDFLEEKICGRPILPVGMQLLEVKYDALLPDHIYQILQLENMPRTAFSKYYLCRKYNNGNL